MKRISDSKSLFREVFRRKHRRRRVFSEISLHWHCFFFLERENYTSGLRNLSIAALIAQMISEVELNNKLHWLFHPDSAFYFFPSRRCCEHFYSIAMFKWVWFSSQLCIYPLLYIRNFHNASIKLFHSWAGGEQVHHFLLSRVLCTACHTPRLLSVETHCTNGKGMFTVLLQMENTVGRTFLIIGRHCCGLPLHWEMSIKAISTKVLSEKHLQFKAQCAFIEDSSFPVLLWRYSVKPHLALDNFYFFMIHTKCLEINFKNNDLNWWNQKSFFIFSILFFGNHLFKKSKL